MKGLLFIVVLLIPFGLEAQSFIPGKSYFGANRYSEYIAGNLPIIMAMPHGGPLRPDDIPNRSCSGCNTTNDSFTRELGLLIYDEINRVTGCHPHVIINQLHRSKMDANREIVEAADGNKKAEVAWMDFQGFIDTASFQVSKDFGKGLFIDLHGHAHTIQRLELGYLLSSSELQSSDEDLNNTPLLNESSIQHLLDKNLQNLSHSALIRGEQSLGTLISERNFDAVPSNLIPFPKDGEPYFSGGYNTRRHGSIENGTVDAIQVECNRDVRFNEATRESFAKQFAAALIEYLQLHYFDGDLDMSCQFITDIQDEKGDEIFFYPNPVNHTLYINGNQVPEKITLINVFSQLIKIWDKPNTNHLSLSDVEKGIYIMVWYENGKVQGRSKIVKQ